MDVICRNQATYTGFLSRGKRYTVVVHDADKAQVKVQDDSGRHRWFPAYCFTTDAVPSITCISVVEREAAHATWDRVEVEIDLSNGQRRWCVCATPAGLATLALYGGMVEIDDSPLAPATVSWIGAAE